MAKQIKVWISICLLLCTSTLSTSCSKNQTRANLLDPEVKYRADTMYAHRRIEITKALDSLCISKMPELVATARDSLIEIDLERINRIRNR